MSGSRILLGTIVGVRSTACNQGPVSSGCMTMQSTTRNSTLNVIRCRQSSDSVAIDQVTSWESESDFCASTDLRADKWNGDVDRAVINSSAQLQSTGHFGPTFCYRIIPTIFLWVSALSRERLPDQNGWIEYSNNQICRYTRVGAIVHRSRPFECK